MNKPTVVIVSDYAFVNGGGPYVATAEAKALARAGYPVILFASVGPPDPSIPEAGVKVICTGQMDIHDDPWRARAVVRGLWNFSAARIFRELLSGLNPATTVIHAHGWTQSLTSSVLASALNRRFKIVVTPHAYFLACPNGAFLHYGQCKKCPLTAMSLRCILSQCDSRNYARKLWRVTRQAVEMLAAGIPENIDHFIFPSALNRRILTPYLPSGARLYNISNPIDVPRQDAIDASRNDVFGFVGRLSPEKGAVLFAKAAALAKVPAVVIGDGPERERVQRTYPEAQVMGWMDRPAVLKNLRRLRALVFPSVCYEVAPLVVLEAASQGVPVIVSDETAPADYVREAASGLVFNNGSAQSLADALLLMKDDAVVRGFGQKAYSRFWADPPTLERHVQELENVYRAILSA